MRKHFTEIVFLILYIENCFPQIVFSSFIKEAEKVPFEISLQRYVLFFNKQKKKIIYRRKSFINRKKCDK
jgi:hypothetical protein